MTPADPSARVPNANNPLAADRRNRESSNNRSRSSTIASGGVSTLTTALITGITGQDGSYLSELLLHKGYEVHGMVRRASTESFERIGHLTSKITLHQADLLDQLSIITLVRDIQPQEVYNLAADMGGMGFIENNKAECMLSVLINTHLLMAAHDLGITRFFYASSGWTWHCKGDEAKIDRCRNHGKSGWLRWR